MLSNYIAPSILGCDLSNLQKECEDVISGGCDWLHLDIMDGHFVPNLSIGPPVVSSLRKHLPSFYLDCHLMVTNPESWVLPLSTAGASGFTFHIESVSNEDSLIALLSLIRSKNMRTGIAIKPSSEIPEILCAVIDKGLVDLVLVMTVEPGFGGQKFISSTMSKVAFFRSRYPNIDIEVDGGVNSDNIATCKEQGANAFVLGTFVFNSINRKETLRELKEKLVGVNDKS